MGRLVSYLVAGHSPNVLRRSPARDCLRETRPNGFQQPRQAMDS